MLTPSQHVYIINRSVHHRSLTFSILQDDFPLDKKAVQNLAVGAAGMATAFLYFYFRETGVQISWKDFVHHYLSRDLVSGGEWLYLLYLDFVCNAPCFCIHVDKWFLGPHRWITWRLSTNNMSKYILPVESEHQKWLVEIMIMVTLPPT